MAKTKISNLARKRSGTPLYFKNRISSLQQLNASNVSKSNPGWSDHRETDRRASLLADRVLGKAGVFTLVLVLQAGDGQPSANTP